MKLCKVTRNYRRIEHAEYRTIQHADYSAIAAWHHRKKNVDGAMHFIYSHKYYTNSAEDSSDMN